MSKWSFSGMSLLKTFGGIQDPREVTCHEESVYKKNNKHIRCVGGRREITYNGDGFNARREEGETRLWVGNSVGPGIDGWYGAHVRGEQRLIIQEHFRSNCEMLTGGSIHPLRT